MSSNKKNIFYRGQIKVYIQFPDQVAEKNRSCYRRLRTELEDLTEQGVFMLGKFQEEGANVMQKLAVQMLCYQLDNTWQYFTRTFKMQVNYFKS